MPTIGTKKKLFFIVLALALVSVAATTLINLTTQVTGVLPHTNGGTDVSAPGTSGNVLTSNGTNWTSAAGGGSSYGNESAGYAFMGPEVGSSAVPYIVQSAACYPATATGATTMTVACTFNSSTTTGNMIVAYLGAGSTNTLCSSCTYNAAGADTQSNTYTVQSVTGSAGNTTFSAYSAYAPNITGGVSNTVTLTFTTTSGNFTSSVNVQMVVLEIANAATSPIDTSAYNASNLFSTSGTYPFSSVTTSNASGMILALGNIITSSSNTVSLAHGAGFTTVQNVSQSTNTLSTLVEASTVTATGTYTPTASYTCSLGVCNYREFVFAIKGVAPPATGPAAFRPITWPDLTIGAFMGLTGVNPSSTTGDTQIDLHVGAPINAEAQTSAFSGTVLFPVPSGNDLTLMARAYVDCYTSVSTATIIPKIIYTDASSTSQTITGGTATCTTLGTNSTAYIAQPIRAKAGTNVTFTTTLANSPHFDVHASIAQASNQ